MAMASGWSLFDRQTESYCPLFLIITDRGATHEACLQLLSVAE
jgi:hypothetical protein